MKNRYTYDMEDFWGEKDWTKMFVTKLIYTQSGNCHSLPALYKILADELNVSAWLALAPNHTYIKQWNDKTGWYNTELTTGQFPFDHDIKFNSYIKTEAIAAGVYMDTLSVKENIAYVITDLAHGFTKKFGFDDTATPLRWLETAIQYFPDYVNALILKAELQKKEYEKLMKDKKTNHFTDLWKDVEMKNKFNMLEQSYYNIHQIGHRRMPKEMYLNWLFRVQNDTTRKPFHFETPQPFKQYNYDVQVVTAGDGQNYEFFDQDTLARIGTITINTLNGRIVNFVEEDSNKDNMPEEVISRMYDPALGKWWQVDPLAEDFYSWSPYNFVYNNPVNFVDPDGQSGIAAIDEKNKTITVSSHMVFYGSKATDDVAKASAAEIQNMYNAAGGKVTVDGVEYTVQFNVTYEVVSEDKATEMASENTSALNNFVRIEETNKDGRSNMQLGGNAGHWVTSDKLGKSTTAAHEAGHGYGLEHSERDQRGKGAPDIMAARGTLVDSEYQYDSKAAAGAAGGTVNPAKRVVKQENITNMFSGVKFTDGKANIGTATNTLYDKVGNPK